VIATVEVKSMLSKEGLEQAMKAAKTAKALEASVTTGFSTGYIPPKVLNFMLMQGATANSQGQWLNPAPYLKSFRVPCLSFRR
jgi:hypothetical protein